MSGGWRALSSGGGRRCGRNDLSFHSNCVLKK